MPAHNVHIHWRKKSQNRIRKIWLLLRSANKAELMRFTAAQKPKRGFSYIHSLIDNGISKGEERRGIYFIWFFYFSDSKVIGVSLLSAWGQQLLMFVVLGRKSQALIVSSYIHSPLEKKNPGCDQQSHLLWQFDSIGCICIYVWPREPYHGGLIYISNSHSGRTLVFIHVTHPFTSVWLWSLLILCVLENLAKGFSSHFFLGPFSDASK